MMLARFFVDRPVGTSLITIALFLAGILGYVSLPVADLPAVNFPVIMVIANQPGSSPSEIANTTAEPLEKHLGAIAGIREITSQSTTNQTRISLQFDLSRDINGAARDVQSSIRAARQDLPTTLRSDPSYIKANANGFPIMVLTLTSSTRTPQQLYDSASNIIVPGLSQVSGVGNVEIKGSALPAVRIEINPLRLFRYGIGFEGIRASLASANAHTPKGFLENNGKRMILATNDQATGANAYRDLIIAYRDARPVRLSDVADILDGAEDLRQSGFVNGKPDIICTVFPQSGANIIKTTNDLKARLPKIRNALPRNSQLDIRLDSSIMIRSALTDTQLTLLLSVILVTLVVLIFLRRPTTVLIPAIVVPISIISTFGVMSLLKYQIDIMSLMALTIATGFVVDDAIVVLENIIRYIEMGYSPRDAAIQGTKEITFTVISITLSLVVVFTPILLMGGIAGKFFHEFAMTMICVLTISLFLSLSLTPMLSAHFLLPSHRSSSHVPRFVKWLSNISESSLTFLTKSYTRSLRRALLYPWLIILSLPLTLLIAMCLFVILPKELIPQQDQGMLMGRLIADQSVSFHALQEMTHHAEEIIAQDPDVDSVIGGLGKNSANSMKLFVTLKPREKRHSNISVTISRLNSRFVHQSGLTLRLHLPSLIGSGARSSDGAYQYTLQGNSTEELYEWTPRIIKALSQLPMIRDISSDIEQNGRGVKLLINRNMEARYSITPQLAGNTLYDAFGQRSASIIYGSLNQYRVIMEAAPSFWANPIFLRQMWVSTSGGTSNGGYASNSIRVRQNTSTTLTPSQSQLSYQNAMANSLAGGKSASNGSAVSTQGETLIPLEQIGEIRYVNEPLTVNHQGQFVATTISFNLVSNKALGSAITAVQNTISSLNVPSSIKGGFAGNAATLKKSSSQEPLLIFASLAIVYIVLGILYESLIHPITILSTLPSAGVGALLAIAFFDEPFSLFTLIGIILLIGIVKKNAIMLIDFAIVAQRTGLSAHEAIVKASELRLRPILMTSFAAALGALPLLIGNGYGSEMRHPLGLSILGGLCLSQLLTLYTTPVVYIYLDKFNRWIRHF